MDSSRREIHPDIVQYNPSSAVKERAKGIVGGFPCQVPRFLLWGWACRVDFVYVNACRVKHEEFANLLVFGLRMYAKQAT